MQVGCRFCCSGYRPRLFAIRVSRSLGLRWPGSRGFSSPPWTSSCHMPLSSEPSVRAKKVWRHLSVLRSGLRLQSAARCAREQKAQPERNARVLCHVTRALSCLQARAVRKGQTTVGEEVRGRPVLWRSAPRRGVCRAWCDRALVRLRRA